MTEYVRDFNAMSTILVPETFLVEMIFVHHNQRVENCYHVRTPGSPPTIADLVAARNIFNTWWTSTTAGNLRVQTSGRASMVKIECTSLHAVGGPVDEFVPSPILTGNGGNIEAPTYYTICVKWGTGKSGRSYRGRSYMVAPAHLVASDGLIGVAPASAIQTAFQRILTDINATGMQLVVASKYSGVEIVNGRRRAIPRAAGITTPITTVSVERGPDTRRSRKIPHLV